MQKRMSALFWFNLFFSLHTSERSLHSKEQSQHTYNLFLQLPIVLICFLLSPCLSLFLSLSLSMSVESFLVFFSRPCLLMTFSKKSFELENLFDFPLSRRRSVSFVRFQSLRVGFLRRPKSDLTFVVEELFTVALILYSYTASERSPSHTSRNDRCCREMNFLFLFRNATIYCRLQPSLDGP